MKLRIEKVANGYIVRWVDHGQSAFKEPYEKTSKVFERFDDMCHYLEKTLEHGDEQ